VRGARAWAAPLADTAVTAPCTTLVDPMY
jgi:hypothetical protein